MSRQRTLANAAPGPGAFRGVHPHEPPPASGVWRSSGASSAAPSGNSAPREQTSDTGIGRPSAAAACLTGTPYQMTANLESQGEIENFRIWVSDKFSAWKGG